MRRFFRNLSIKTKLLSGFGLILFLGVGLQFFTLINVYRLTKLVRVMYDNPLMSSTFAQSAKYDYAKFDLLFRELMTSKNEDDIKKYKAKAYDFFILAIDDLNVVLERTLHDENRDLAKKLLMDFEKINKTREAVLKNLNDPKNLEQWKSDTRRSDIEANLTRLTDNEAELGFNFRENSDKYNRLILYLTYFLNTFSFVLGILSGFLVLRGILRPVNELAAVCGLIAAGDFSHRANNDTSAELKTLADTFNLMITQIEQKNANIKSLLGGMNDGLFFFDKTYSLSEERSMATDQIFPNFKDYKKVDQFLAHLVNLPEQELKETIDLLWGNTAVGFSDITALLPQEANLNSDLSERHVTLKYNPQQSLSGVLEKVVVVVKDDTEEVRARSQSEYQNQRVARITAVSANLNNYTAFVEENQSFFASIRKQLTENGKPELVQLKRDLHNLKGTLSLYAFASCVRILQNLETVVAESSATPDIELWRSLFTQLSDEYEKDLRDLNDVFGTSREQVAIPVSLSKLRALKSAIEFKNNQKIFDIVKTLARNPASQFFEKYQKYLTALAFNSGATKKVQLSYHADCCELALEEVRHLDKVFGHLFRNSFDHGIEPISVRTQAGKTATGNIEVLCWRAPDDLLTFIISDDGNGIRTDKLVAKAIKNGIWTESRAASASLEEKINLVFAPDLSTLDEVSETSGRGVGMDAVKSYLESLGGSIEVRPGQVCGTQVVIKVPAATRSERQLKAS